MLHLLGWKLRFQSDAVEHGRRSMGGQVDMSPYFSKWSGRPVFCPEFTEAINAKH